MSNIMNDFPFSPFFEILERDGFRVTIRDYRRVAAALRASGPLTEKRLKTVLMSLLVRDIDQKDLFERRFDAFFDRDLGTRIEEIDMERAISDLETISKSDVVSKRKRKARRKRVRLPEPPPAKSRRPLLFLLPILLIAVAVLIYIDPFEPTQTPVATPTPAPLQTPEPGFTPAPTPSTSTPKSRVRVYENVPTVTVKYTEPEDAEWKIYASISGGMLAALMLFMLYGRISTKIPEDKAPEWSRDAPRHFRLGQIGGKLPPRLDGETLDRLADLLGYFEL